MNAKTSRVRRTHSVSAELLVKSREAALAAVQIFNSPLITFKSEIFIVLMTIAWTYLLHAYYRKNKIEYRYFNQKVKKRVFQKTATGAHKLWGLDKCLNNRHSPIDADTKNNLQFLIGIRHEIEHQMTTNLDASISAKFQACCLNYNEYVKGLFDKKYGIDKHLSLSLQFCSISKDQVDSLPLTMPARIRAFVEGFEKNLSADSFNNPKYAYRVLFTAMLAGRKGKEDQVMKFVSSDSDIGKNVNAAITVLKATEREKFLPSKILKIMATEGFGRFTMNDHINYWKTQDAKNPTKGYGALVEGTWYWYECWLEKVRKHCADNRELFHGVRATTRKNNGRRK